MQPAKTPVERMTVEDYLRMERASPERHVYLDGRVWAMAGESMAHGDVTFNLATVIGPQLKGTPCRGKVKETKVRSGPAGPRPFNSKSGMFSYPDLVVVCGEPEVWDEHDDVLTNPKVIIEVLSPSTESFDRKEKFDRYERWNPTLTDYLLVSQDTRRVEHYSRLPDGGWRLDKSVGLDAVCEVASIGCRLPLADVYDRVKFPDPAD